MVRHACVPAAFCAAALVLGCGPVAAGTSEAVLVAQEACGPDPQAKCLQELGKVCHAPLTFRCYYSRKGRLDAIRQVGFPEDRSSPRPDE